MSSTYAPTVFCSCVVARSGGPCWDCTAKFPSILFPLTLKLCMFSSSCMTLGRHVSRLLLRSRTRSRFRRIISWETYSILFELILRVCNSERLYTPSGRCSRRFLLAFRCRRRFMCATEKFTSLLSEMLRCSIERRSAGSRRIEFPWRRSVRSLGIEAREAITSFNWLREMSSECSLRRFVMTCGHDAKTFPETLSSFNCSSWFSSAGRVVSLLPWRSNASSRVSWHTQIGSVSKMFSARLSWRSAVRQRILWGRYLRISEWVNWETGGYIVRCQRCGRDNVFIETHLGTCPACVDDSGELQWYQTMTCMCRQLDNQNVTVSGPRLCNSFHLRYNNAETAVASNHQVGGCNSGYKCLMNNAL